MIGAETIRHGTILKALPCHPIIGRGGDGIAFVTTAREGENGITILWVNGDPRTPAFAGDLANRTDVGVWFEIASEEEAMTLLPAGFIPPPDPEKDPAGTLQAIFGGILG